MRRKRLGLTQDQLAQKAGVSRRVITRCETGEATSTQTLEKLAKALDVSPGWLLGGPGDRLGDPLGEGGENEKGDLMDESPNPYGNNSTQITAALFARLQRLPESIRVHAVTALSLAFDEFLLELAQDSMSRQGPNEEGAAKQAVQNFGKRLSQEPRSHDKKTSIP